MSTVAPAQIRISGVGHEFRAKNAGTTTRTTTVVALRDIDVTIAAGELVCLLGPSGCGKSTLLNAVAGFVKPTRGAITIDDVAVTGPGPDRGMVFQEYALFPWMTVSDNVGFGLRIQRRSEADVHRRVSELLEMFGLAGFADRFPSALSGGMRQRAAIARVLAIDSPILLMDEPFGALDALTRRSLQDQLLALWAELRKTIVFVTHNIEEAIYLADRIILMTYRPGTIQGDIAIPLRRPRDPGDPAFIDLEREITRMVMIEQHRRETDERAPPSSVRG